MPLSDHEQRMLAEIERALYAEDPKFATTVRTTTLRTHYVRRIALSGVLVVAGLVVLLVAVVNPDYLPLGLVGFLLMLAGVLSVVTNIKRMRTGVIPKGGRAARGSSSGEGRASKRGSSGKRGLGGRFQERWERRMDERGGDDNY